MRCVDSVLVTAVAAVDLDEFARLKSLVFLIGSAGPTGGLRFGVVFIDLPANASLSSYVHSGESMESIPLWFTTQYNTT